MERSYDAEEVENDKLEGARGKGEEDQGPGQAEDQAEAQQRQHMRPFLVVWAQPQDLHHHGAQHGQVKQEHQAEEAKVGDVADQGVPDPAPAGQGARVQTWPGWGRKSTVDITHVAMVTTACQLLLVSFTLSLSLCSSPPPFSTWA